MTPSESTVLSLLATRLVGTPPGALATLASKAFSLTSTGSVLAATPGQRYKVCACKLIVSAAISVNWRDGTTDLEGAQPFAANGGYVESVTPPSFLFTTTYGNSLDLVIVGVGTASGRLTYWLEKPQGGP